MNAPAAPTGATPTQPATSRWRALRSFLSKALHLSLPYFRSEEKWKARALLAAIIALNLGAVYMLVQINEWNRLFYDALQNKDQAAFWTQLGRFAVLAFIYIAIAIYRFYLTQLLELRWRAWMTAQYATRWLSDHAFYRIELSRFTRADTDRPDDPAAQPDNPDQRIQEDINLFTTQTVGLSMGLLNATVTLVSFVGILWSLSGPFAFELGGQSWSIPGFMVWMAVVYALAGSWLAHRIGRPLIGLNFRQQRYEADFRHHLVRVREYSEAIALDRGEAAERRQIDLRFKPVLQNMLELLRAQKRLTGFTVGFGQAAVVFPFLVAAPRFFSGAIQLGELMQIASAFSQVQDALSWFVNNYDALASWRATTDRLSGFDARLSEGKSPDSSAKPCSDAPENEAPRATDLHIALPDGTPLVAAAQLAVAPQASVLLAGPSGAGKSTVFRALAGIWPHAQGTVCLPPDSMFIPQRPYMPNGSLRAALAYPEPPERYDDAALRQALEDALLPNLVNRLDDADAWSQKLSGGEQQRLAIARVLLKRPRWVFADEATSALDAEAEATLYARLAALAEQRGGALVSIAHRPSVAAFHPVQWRLVPQAQASSPSPNPAQPQATADAARYRLEAAPLAASALA